jgi:hypothetical protein
MSGGDEGGNSKTGAGWTVLFDALPLAAALEREGHVGISADDIKNMSGREPRLMTKFDTREARPAPLKNATILATRNGMYQIVAGDGYLDVPKHVVASRFRVPVTRFQTLAMDCVSESQVLDLAHATGILEDFAGERRLWLTGRGRRRTRPFAFTFAGARGPLALDVDGVQIEVDGGYEGDAIYVVEAKIGLRDNFLVRQLYYPYRMWQAAGVTKPIVPIFVCYSNRQVLLHQYDFARAPDYHSIVPVKSAVYSLDPEVQLPTLAEILKLASPGAEPREVPFPQADDLRRVIDVVDAVAAGINSRAAITDLNDFASRQSGYYADAARYLGLIERSPAGYQLRPAGRAFVRSSHGARLQTLAETVAARPALRAVIDDLRAGAAPESAARHLATLRPELTGSTLLRRVQTVKRWHAWLDAALTAS